MEGRLKHRSLKQPDRARSPLPGGPEPRALIVGLGRSGIWAARYLAAEGARVTVTDIRDKSEFDPVILGELMEAGVELEAGGHREETFLRADFIVLSPGVPHDAGPVRSAVEKKIPVFGEMELASRFVKAPIIAVTGTNGKTTVTTFIGRMLENAGFRVFLGGNIGTPLAAHVAEGQEVDYLVLEVSSFQLDTIQSFSPLISIILNISPDHLERYPDYDAYVRSKLRIYENQGPGQYLIMNHNDQTLSSIRPRSGVSLLAYGLEKKEGLHAFLEGDMISAGLPPPKMESFSLDQFILPGAHNRENLLGAVLAGMVLGVDPAAIQKTINRFKGLPHRLEYAGTKRGVLFYNDSKATNVDAAIKGVRSFNRPLILVAGGRHKGADYAPLVRACASRVKGAVFLGEAREILAESFRGTVPFSFARTMEEAVSSAFLAADEGDVVLLSPACSSFDMFSDYRHRGRVFREAVEALSNG
ncbi:MAG: UDP-N-acetylmuramoyl-L-alanine--D-glutamate ligase [Deltaproteobacteria bacterium]|nr:UDP-N-acetylmuramoyl-L-alanine--D-glutamate ligase [Deltaproteobacteria bacterium]MBW2352544.1 UDP-N-acetylmuramoyl-L-alanine--D-glutamate ligase [Deltaproteobacteria bacterium]